MLDIKRAYMSSLKTHPEDELRQLYTPWGERLDPEAVLQEHPRPHMRRESYANLNGWWECSITRDQEEGADEPPVFTGRILVPFSPESALSGVGHHLQPNETLWYRKSVSLVKKPGMRYLLHFGAVDHRCECIVNGCPVGTHEGGYTPFAFDVTEAIFKLGTVESVVTIDIAVRDPSEHGTQPRGKQRLERGSIWYTAQSGIWQTVWMEEVPQTYIERLRVDSKDHSIIVHVDVAHPMEYEGASFSVDVFDEGELVTSASTAVDGTAHQSLEIEMPDPKLWSPEAPHLYDLGITFANDAVGSYCAMRTFSLEVPEGSKSGRPMFCCNHEPLFLKGILDQGYWPDGLMTAPSDEALVSDIERARDLGFNMLRKHLKVEQERWYYHCDRLGMIVWQDLVNGGASEYPAFYTSQMPTLFPAIAKRVDDTKDQKRFGGEGEEYHVDWLREAEELIESLRFFPCIAAWTVFNEAWGQFDAQEVTEKLRTLDATRLFDQASGWFDQRGGDFISEHNYFRDLRVPKGYGKSDKRASVISEFGGIALHIEEYSCLERSYGYGNCEDADEFERAVREKLREADALESKGLAGYVYTQLTDVEEEVNGLITYDRRVVKISRNLPQESPERTTLEEPEEPAGSS